MRYDVKVAALVAVVALVGCGEGGTTPGEGGGGDAIARQFEQLADSVEGGGGGYSPTAEALRHAAEIVRLAGGATPVTVTIDGRAREFLAVAEQLDFPNVVCTWPDSGSGSPPPEAGTPGANGECEEVGTSSMRTLIAWEPDEMAEVVRVVADLGRTEVQPGVPDVMTGLPSGSPAREGDDPPPATPDSAVGLFPGFMGEYLVRDVGSWWAVQGTQSNDLTGSSGACTEDTVTFDWARFECRAARFRFEVDMRVGEMRIDPLPDPSGSPGAAHEISLGPAEIAGVRLEVTQWTPPAPPPVDTLEPPPAPPPGPPPGPPVDSTEVSPE